MLDGMSDSIQRSRIEKLHSMEVDRQSPTGLIFILNNSCILEITSNCSACVPNALLLAYLLTLVSLFAEMLHWSVMAELSAGTCAQRSVRLVLRRRLVSHPRGELSSTLQVT